MAIPMVAGGMLAAPSSDGFVYLPEYCTIETPDSSASLAFFNHIVFIARKINYELYLSLLLVLYFIYSVACRSLQTYCLI